MTHTKVIIDKNYPFDFAIVLNWIIFFSLLAGGLSLFSYFQEPEYASRESVLEGFLFFLVLSILTIIARFTLTGFPYIDLETKEFRMYIKIFWFEFTYLMAKIEDINEMGVSSLRYTHGGQGTPPSSTDVYFIILLKNNGKIIRISGESTDLLHCNNWMQKLAEKLQKPTLIGVEAMPLYCHFDKKLAKYKLDYASGLKAIFGRENNGIKYLFIFFILMTTIIVLIK